MKKTALSTKFPVWIYGIFSILLILHVIFFFAGFYADDDINFARYAAEIKNQGFAGRIAYDHFELRWTPIYATAFFYRLFGINDFTSSLYSLLCILGCAWLLVSINKQEGWRILLATCTLFFFGRSIIFYSHRLLADAGICLAVFAMYFAYRNVRHQTFRASLLFSLAFLFAVITKESIVIALPLFVFLFTRDLYRKKNLKFWFVAAGLSLLFLFLYLLYFRISTGDWFFRYHLLYLRSYKNICSFDQLPAIATLRRVGYELWNAMLLNGDFLVLIPAVTAIFYLKPLQAEGLRRLDLLAFFLLLLSANFMSISWKSYVPLCHDPRHFLFIMPFAALAGGRMLVEFSGQPRKYLLLPILYAVAGLILFTQGAGATKYLYLFAAAASTMVCLFPKLPFLPALILIFSSNYFLDLFKPLYPYHTDNKKVANQIPQIAPAGSVIYTQGFTGEMAEYYMRFPSPGYRFIVLDSLSDSSKLPAYFLLDGKNDLFTKEDILQLPGAKVLDSSNQSVLFQADAEFLQTLRLEYQNRKK